MADDAFVPCREWLGIEPGELRVPHRVVGVAVHENDPLVIVRAADRRLAVLRGVSGGHGEQRDALIAQVEAARNALLAAAAARSASPPVPPPVPPAGPPQIVVRRVPRRRRGGGVAASLGITSLAIAAAALALYLAWPHLQPGRSTARRTTLSTAADSQSPQEVEPQATRSPDRSTATRRIRQPRPEPEHGPGPEPQPPPSRPVPAATDETRLTEPPAPPVPDISQIRPVIDEAITKSLAALREGDHPAAKQTLADVLATALVDQQATDRVQRWQLLAEYAGQFSGCREKALRSAADNAATYNLGDVQIAVIEFTPEKFVYRDSRRPGRNLRVRSDRIPADVEQGLIEAWFSADDQAANHLILGAKALVTDRPDLARVRQEFQKAAAMGEPQGDTLSALLDDPAIEKP